MWLRCLHRIVFTLAIAASPFIGFCQDILPYPVGLYPLNNIHKTDDASCYGNLGGTAEDAHLVTGPLSEPDTAYEFAGSSTSYIDIPRLQHFDADTSITILVWILQTGQAGSVFKYGNSDRKEGRCSPSMTYSLELYTSRTYSFSAQFVEPNGESVSLSNNTVTLVNKWRYAGVSYNRNSGTATLWIDGNDVQKKNLKKLKLCTDEDIRIGAREGEDKSFQGRISCLQIYDRELTTKEVAAVKNRCFNGSQPPVDCTKASVQSCGVSMSTLSGTFVSPGYPTGYPYDTACVWDIKVPSGYIITLKFRDFDLEKSYSSWPDCPDYVIVRDGINSWSKTLKSLCGGQTGWGEEIITSGNVMRVEFKTDRERSAQGFTAEYTTSIISEGESDEKGLIDFSRHYTGIVIGVACAAIFAILAIMIFSHTRRRLRGNHSDTLTRRQSMPFSDNDVFQQNAPPTYDDVMRCPELYPPTPCQGSLANTPAATPRRGSPVSTPTLPHRLLNPPRSPALIPKVGTPIGMPLLNTWRGISTPPSTSRVSLQRGISPLARAELTPQHSRPADHLSSDEQDGDEDDEELPPYPGIVNVASVLNQVRETLELSRLATRQTSNPSLSDSSNLSDSNDNRTVSGQRRPRDTRAAVMENTGDVQTSLEPNREQSAGDNNTGDLDNPWISSKVTRVAAPGRTLRSIESDV